MCTDGKCGLCMGWNEAAMLIGAGVSAGGSAAAANATSNAAQSNNSANMEVAAIGNLVNISEAAKARDFNSREAEYARTFANDSAVDQRNWSAQQAGIAREFNEKEATTARNFNASEAQKGRDYEERMSNTQYQRAVGDMQAAGLNPMLAYSQGGAGNVKGATASSGAASAGAPSGSSASTAQAGSSPMAGANIPRLDNPGPGGIGSMSAAGAIANQIADLRSKDAQTNLVNAQAKKTEGEIPHGALTTQKLQDEVNVLKNTFQERVKGVKSDQDTKYNQADISHIQRGIAESEAKLAEGKITVQELQKDYMRANNELTRLGIPGAQNEATFQKQMETAPQYMKFLSTVLSGAAGFRRAVSPFGRGD